MKNVIIIGAGGFTRELYSYLKDANYEIIGYIDIQENNFFDLKYLGNDVRGILKRTCNYPKLF